MKNSSNLIRTQLQYTRKSSHSAFRSFTASAVLFLLLNWCCSANAQSDNFNSYTDTTQLRAAGWFLSSLNPALVTTTFPAVGAGKGIRVQANPIPGTAPAVGIWYRTNEYTDFYVSLDIVNWPGTDKNLAMVLFGRATAISTGTVTTNLNPADTQSMICNYDASQDGENPTDRRKGQFQINRVGANFATSTRAAADITFVPGRSYRIIFKAVGTLYTAQAYDLNDLTAPLVTLQADVPDAFAPSGACGFDIFNRQSGFNGTADATYDNYYAGATDPNVAPAPALAHPIAGTPQVVTRNPTNRFKNFHPASSEISFTARTFSTNQVDTAATKLFLNAADVSASLAPLPVNGTSASFSAVAGTLAENKVYSARIELQDTTGTLRSTNTFWFDTFTDAFLTNAPVKTIEAEEYNYSTDAVVGGQYQLDPIPVSGYDTNTVLVNGFGVGYLDQRGLAEVDFHDNRTSAEGGFNDFRFSDPVGTAHGNKDILDSFRTQNDSVIDFAQRQRYAGTGVLEYVVARTEPGEWLNYTRVFDNTNYYVYLRVGSFGATDVRLDRVSGDPTTTNQTTTALGTFSIPNNIMHINHTYEPLRSPGGSPVVVRLSGTNTLRLTMLGTTGQDNRKLNINYLLFVPTDQGPTIFDNFNDGNDTANPPWDHYDPIGGVTAPPAGFLLTNGGYRIYSPAPSVSAAGPARAASFLRNASYGDFYISADVIDFDDTVRQAFGVAARINTPGLGTSGGYTFTWEPGSGTLPGTTNGDLDISRLVNESPSKFETAPSGLHLTRGKSYRFVFIGKGFDFEGQVYELPDTFNPLIRLPAHDALELYPSGQVGLITADQGSGVLNQGDATFDNFLITTAEPRLTANLSGGSISLSWPQIPFRLQSSPSVSPTVWTDVTSGISQAGDQNVYVVPATGSQKYFRLVYP